MTYDEYKTLTEDEQRALYNAMDEKSVLYDDMEAERDSFKNENDQLKSEISEVKTEMKKTKELNFTLARSARSEPKKSAEDILHEMFIK